MDYDSHPVASTRQFICYCRGFTAFIRFFTINKCFDANITILFISIGDSRAIFT